MKIDLRAEQQKSLERPHLKYSLSAKILFFSMDLAAGKKNTLPKAKLLEILASIPYRQWEIRKYIKQTLNYANLEKVEEAQKIIDWGREAQDNEYTHLLVIQQKMIEDGIKDKWYLAKPLVFFIVYFYVFLSKMIAIFNIKGAYLFNAEFEDHAEHIYAQMVEDNPQWETQKVENEFVKNYSKQETWANVFRRIGLDERDHRNNSFHYAGKPEFIVEYDGMEVIDN